MMSASVSDAITMMSVSAEGDLRMTDDPVAKACKDCKISFVSASSWLDVSSCTSFAACSVIQMVC